MFVVTTTHNNSHAVVGLITSLLMHYGPKELHLVLVDSSDTPINTEPHLARVLAALGSVIFIHTHQACPVYQRREGLKRVPSMHTAILIDADCVLLEAATDVRCSVDAGCVRMGLKLDLFNDMNYPDFVPHDSKYDPDSEAHHVLSQHNPHLEKFGPMVRMKAVEQADPGFMYGDPGAMLSVFARAEKYSKEPSIIDDAAARILVEEGAKIDPVFVALHVGNSNRWPGTKHKQEAVKAVVEKASC